MRTEESALSSDELERRPARAPDYARENQALLALADALTRSPQELLDRLAQLALDCCHADTAGVQILDEGGRELLAAHAASPAPVAAAVAELLKVPLPAAGRALGAIWVTARTGPRFDQEDARVLRSLAQFAAAAVQAGRPLHETTRRLEAEIAVLNRLHELMTRLTGCANLDRAFDEILDAALTMHGANRGTVIVHHPTSQRLQIVAQRGFGQAFLEHFSKLSVDDPAAYGRVLRTRARVIIEDVQTDPEYAPHRAIAAAAGYRAVQATPMFNRSGELVGILSTHFPEPHRPSERDLRLLDVYARLAGDFSERLRAEAALRELDRRKEEFLAMLGHELRNPLAPIRHAVELFHLQTQQSPEIEYARDVIDRQVQQLSRLVDDLLDASRVSQGKITLQKRPVALGDVMAQAVEASRPLIDAREHRLTAVAPPEPLHVHADPVRLAQVVANLLNNAAKYSPERSHILLSAVREGTSAVLRVRDTGSGIAAELLPKLFEMFVQAERSLDRAQGGLGIGLALVKRLVELHGGQVSVHSDGLGRGSEFTVRLPLLDTGAVAAPVAVRAAAASRALRILVVDDNRDSADSLAMFLELQGHQVRTAYDAPTALTTAQELRPQFVLLDIGLPDGVSGYDLARQLRQQEPARPLTLIAVTGYGQEEDRRLSREAGFDAHLVKPADFAILSELLRGEPDR